MYSCIEELFVTEERMIDMLEEKVDQSNFADTFAFKISPKLVEQNILRSPGPNEGIAPISTGRTRITLPAPHGKGFSENKAQLFVPDSAVQMNGEEPAVVTVDKGARIRTATTADEGWRPASYIQSVVESRLGKSAVVGFEQFQFDFGEDASDVNVKSRDLMSVDDNDKEYGEVRERVAVDAVDFTDKSEMSFDDLEK